MFSVFLTTTAALLLIVNYYISDRDILNPTVLFCIMNLLSSVMCSLGEKLYRLELHGNTFLVISGGMVIFTIVNVLCRYAKQKTIGITANSDNNNGSNRVIYTTKVQTWWVILFILFEVVVAALMVKYVYELVSAYYGYTDSFGATIGLYNNIVKNHGDEISTLGVSQSRIYAYGWPLCIAVNYILFGVGICNYLKTKKINYLILFSFMLMIVVSFFTGSRSNSMRFATGAFIEWMIIYRMHKGNYRKGNLKLVATIVFLAPLFVLILYNLKNVLGRTHEIVWYEYIMAYIGGPFLNLDVYINGSMVRSEMFGQETFCNFYTFLGGIFNNPELIYSLDLPYVRVDGKFLGNVYTMYYMFIHDFSYLGVPILTAIAAIYYNVTYTKLMNFSDQRPILGIRLFIYCYLSNSLLMLTFSNRFYEDALRSTAIRFYVMLIVFWFIFKKVRIVYGTKRLF